MNALPEVPVPRLDKLILVALLIVAIACFIVGCQKSGCTQVDSPGPIGRLVSLNGCKAFDGEGYADTVSSKLDCIDWEYDGESILKLTHVNAGFNCCPKIDAVTYVEGDTIFVKEHEIEGLCDCICLFDLYYEIRGLEPGAYEVIVSEECLREGDEPLDFTLDLLSSPGGRHCAERDHYPWGF